MPVCNADVSIFIVRSEPASTRGDRGKESISTVCAPTSIGMVWSAPRFTASILPVTNAAGSIFIVWSAASPVSPEGSRWAELVTSSVSIRIGIVALFCAVSTCSAFGSASSSPGFTSSARRARRSVPSSGSAIRVVWPFLTVSGYAFGFG